MFGVVSVTNDALTDDNVTSDALAIGLLGTFEGMLRIVIPAGKSLDDYRTLALYREAKPKRWGVSPLRFISRQADENTLSQSR